jgi:hypothetical protein
VTFSARNIVASGKYSRGSCDSRPGFHAVCFSDGELIFMAQPGTGLLNLVREQFRFATRS